MNGEERVACGTLAALLDGTAALRCLGLLWLALAAVTLLLVPSLGTAGAALATLVLALAAVERSLAVRLAFDARLFDALARDQAWSPEALDDALERLGLRKASAVPRSMANRFAGTKRLMGRHLAVLLLQTALVIALVLLERPATP